MIKLSYTASQMYKNCPKSYFLKYFLKLEEEKKSSALAYGHSVDSGLDVLLSTREIDKAKDEFFKVWSTFKDIDVKYSKSNYIDWVLEEGDEPDEWHSMLRQGMLMLDAYNEQIMPRIKEVVSIQRWVNLTNDEGDGFLGKIDIIVKWEDDRILLVDNKTTSTKYKEDSVRTSEQLASYYEPLTDEMKIDACAYIVLNKRLRKKKLPHVAIDVIIDNIPQELIDEVYDLYEHQIHEIKHGKFEANTEGCRTVYGPCPYYKYCHENSMEGLIINKKRK